MLENFKGGIEEQRKALNRKRPIRPILWTTNNTAAPKRLMNSMGEFSFQYGLGRVGNLHDHEMFRRLIHYHSQQTLTSTKYYYWVRVISIYHNNANLGQILYN